VSDLVAGVLAVDERDFFGCGSRGVWRRKRGWAGWDSGVADESFDAGRCAEYEHACGLALDTEGVGYPPSSLTRLHQAHSASRRTYRRTRWRPGSSPSRPNRAKTCANS